MFIAKRICKHSKNLKIFFNVLTSIGVKTRKNSNEKTFITSGCLRYIFNLINFYIKLIRLFLK